MFSLDANLLAQFLGEMRGRLPELRASLASATTATNLEEALEPAYRHAHTIGGTSILLGLSDIHTIAADLEEGLGRVVQGQQPLDVASLTRFIEQADLVELALDELEAGKLPTVPLPVAEPGIEQPVESDDPVSPELFEVFAGEARDHLTTIQGVLTTLRAQPGNKRLLLDVRRAAHTLKGAAGMVGLHSVSRLTHRMEDLLDWFAEGSAPLDAESLELLVESADVLEDLAGGGKSPAAPALYPRYDAAMTRVRAAAPARAEDTPEPTSAPTLEHEPEPEVEVEPARKGTGELVRVPLERLDGLVKLVGELIMSRTAFEQRTRDFLRLVGELGLSAERLRRSSGKLEREYEASTLGGGSDGPRPTTSDFDALEMDRYTEFHLLTRELAETTIDLQTVGHEFNNLNGDFTGYLTRQSRLTSELQDKLMRIRMVPLATLASRLHRTVRTTARQVGKQVELVLEGAGTELDKKVLEEMTDPLLHLLRNAVDHGIETPEVRRARHKPAHGTIRVRATTEGTQVVLKIHDDGGGFDVDRLRTTIVARGLASASEVATLSPRELAAYVFVPGFSTASAVTEISGRGVGLDIVQAQVHKLKGHIDADSEAGRGTTFTIRLPLTLAVLRALLVRASGQTFAIPLSCVDQILRVEREAETVGQEAVVRVGTKVYPRVDLAQRLNLAPTGAEPQARPPVVLLRAGEQEVALVVDELVGGREIVLKNLGQHLRRVPGFAGATLLGDGSVVLVIDPPDLLRDPGREVARPTLPTAKPSGARTNVLVVDDSPSVRRVVSDLLQNSGWTPTVAKDGLEALELLHREVMLPDVILTDIEMPRMDGYELLSTLQADARLRSIPVVVITSRAGERHRRKALDLGATAYLVKPYPEETLLRTLRELTQSPALATV